MMVNRKVSRQRRLGMLKSAAGAWVEALEALEARTLLSGTSFTIATLSDTQYTVESFPQTFNMQTAWVAAHGVSGTAADAFPDNIAFFAHQGDMLRRGYSDFQAANADAALKNLDGKVPYTVSIGNHDYDNQFDDLDQHVSSANFTRWFGNDRYAAIPNLRVRQCLARPAQPVPHVHGRRARVPGAEHRMGTVRRLDRLGAVGHQFAPAGPGHPHDA